METLLKAKKVVTELNKHGYEAYLVGGFVRDYILGVPSDDIDIATSATPEEVLEVFSKVLPTGLKHGTVTVEEAGEYFEVTTYRIDGDYFDGRRPSSVVFSKDLSEDLSRRDLTINAIAMDLEGRIVDPFGGVDDLKAKVIRTVGNPYERFSEDPLRLLRAIRFATKLDFSIETATLEAISELAPKIKRVSKERITDEILKIFSFEAYLKGLSLLNSSGLLQEIFPEIDKLNLEPIYRLHKGWTVEERIAKAVSSKESLEAFIEGVRMDNKMIKRLNGLVDSIGVASLKELRLLDGVYGMELVKSIININELKEISLDEIRRLPNSLKELPIDGYVLKEELDLKGAAIGKALKAALEAQLETTEIFSKETLLEILKRWYNSWLSGRGMLY